MNDGIKWDKGADKIVQVAPWGKDRASSATFQFPYPNPLSIGVY